MDVKTYILKKLGIWDFIWQKFCQEYPVRIKGNAPEYQHFLEENEKAYLDMLIFGMGAIKCIPPNEIKYD